MGIGTFITFTKHMNHLNMTSIVCSYFPALNHCAQVKSFLAKRVLVVYLFNKVRRYGRA